MLHDSIDTILNGLIQSGNYRTLPEPCSAELVDLTTNDYLGIARRSDFIEEFLADNLSDKGNPFTSSASRLLCAHPDEYRLLENRLSELYCRRAALLFNSGYHANTGMIAALGSLPSTLIVADKLVHASIIDGMKLADAPSRRFAHNNFDHLQRILEKESASYSNIIVVTESVYSMDGDRTNLDRLIELKRRYPAVVLYVDEAHAVGVCGEGGLGLCYTHSAFDEIDIIIGTMGKALASMGAYSICSDKVRRFAINRCRSLIFSTALPPVSCRWSRFVIDKIIGMDSERECLQHHCRAIAAALKLPQPSHIVPVIAYSAQRALQWSESMEAKGFKVLPIRTPTVPPGTERLRLSLSASLTDNEVRSLADALLTLQ